MSGPSWPLESSLNERERERVGVSVCLDRPPWSPFHTLGLQTPSTQEVATLGSKVYKYG